MIEIKYICQYCGKECKNDNSKRSHERLCKSNPNRAESNFVKYNASDHKATNQYIKAKELGLPKPEKSLELRKKLSERMKKDNPMKNESSRKKVSETMKRLAKEGKLKGWLSRNVSSYPERFWMRVLDNNGIPYKREVLVIWGDPRRERYFLDFFIEKNGIYIDLEIDGGQHEKTKEKDSFRDEKLKELNYLVYRVKWNEINSENGKLLMKEKIEKFLEWYMHH